MSAVLEAKGALLTEAAARMGELATGAIATHTDEGRPRKQADVLIDIGCTHHLFHDEGGDPYVAVKVGQRRAVLRVDSADYRDLLSREFYALTGKGANRNAIGDAVATLAARAKYDGPSDPVYLRTATDGSGIALDLGDATGDALIVTAAGWRIGPATLNFRRSGKAGALPRPTTADFSRLWRHVNVDPADRVLVAAWLLASLRPSGPYPIMLLVGEQGVGKSSTSRALKRLTDPSAVLLRAPPRDERDLLVAASNAWAVVLDNMSGASAELSDSLCRVSTGGSLAGRRLYTDADEVLVEVQRPVILNGIDDPATRPDLADRCLHLLLPPLAARQTEAKLARQFEADAPPIMAALLDGLALALRDHAAVRLNPPPRMADFAMWAAAGLPALGFSADEFLAAYERSRADLLDTAIDASPVASALVRFMATRDMWTGSANALLALLADGSQGQAWPRSAKGLIGALRRLAPALRAAGIHAAHLKRERGNVIELCKVGKNPPDVPDVPVTPLSAGASGASGASNVPDVPAKTRIAGASGASGASKQTLHESAPAPCTAAEYAAAKGAEL